MYRIKEFPDKSFSDQGEMFKALRESKHILIAQKKMVTKLADPVFFHPISIGESGEVLKADTFDPASINTLSLDLAINTTKVMDSHSDVHFDGTWNKSVKEKKDIYLLQEHKMSFSNIITDDVKAMVREMTWKELGADYPGTTQVLLFKANITKERNPFMFEQYAKGYVKNHSVGMRYVNLELALNSDSKYDKEEKEIYDKYIDLIVNRDEVEAQGYFWAVHEAKIIEGSAVPVGSNTITPVISSRSKGAVLDTPKIEPPLGTHKVAEFYKNLL